MKLLGCNLQQYSAQVPWEDIPRTFRHAIIAVRNLSNSLGVLYLWIDALCIIQDSDTDMQRELSKMSNIYKHSLCNLATCLGRDSSCGLWQDSEPLQFHKCVVEKGSLSPMDSRVRVENITLYETSVQQSVLNSRAWVLQELTLAPRVVYFTAEQLVWECSEACFYQSSPWQDRSASISRLKWPPLSRSTCLTDSDGPSFDHDYRFWMRKVGDFTGRNLTYDSDTLPAISAIARHVQAMLEPHDEYILGLWKRYLHLHILWQLQTNFKAYEDSKLYKEQSAIVVMDKRERKSIQSPHLSGSDRKHDLSCNTYTACSLRKQAEPFQWCSLCRVGCHRRGRQSCPAHYT